MISLWSITVDGKGFVGVTLEFDFVDDAKAAIVACRFTRRACFCIKHFWKG